MTATQDPFRRLTPVVRLAPAKVNLTLAVLGIRPDGYHELHSIMVPLDLADRLSVSILPPGGTGAAGGTGAPAGTAPGGTGAPGGTVPGGDGDTLHVDGFDPGPVADNLVLRAIAAARRHARPEWGRTEPPPALAARLEKRIPVAAGLAGGSSDAAAAADAALEAWGVELGSAARRSLAEELGSDVPFFLAGGPALVEGRGEHVTPLAWLRGRAGDGPATERATPARDGPALLLVTPAIAISTPAVFRAWDAGARVTGGAARLASAHLAEELRRGIRAADLMARASVLASANDLAPAANAVEPALVPFKRALLRLLGRPVGLSGSGPTHWALYASHAEAAEAADRVRAAIAAGDLVAPGEREPFVAAARILAGTAGTARATEPAEPAEPTEPPNPRRDP
jgi:4-diphosphocytidyl-2-C-methyl-D-erythritol kinase